MSAVTRRGFLGGLAACAGLLLPRGAKQSQLPISEHVATGPVKLMTVQNVCPRMIGNGDPEVVMPLMRDSSGRMGVVTIRTPSTGEIETLKPSAPLRAGTPLRVNSSPAETE